MLVGWAYLFGIVLWKAVWLGNVPKIGRNTNMNLDFTFCNLQHPDMTIHEIRSLVHWDPENTNHQGTPGHYWIGSSWFIANYSLKLAARTWKHPQQEKGETSTQTNNFWVPCLVLGRVRLPHQQKSHHCSQPTSARDSICQRPPRSQALINELKVMTSGINLRLVGGWTNPFYARQIGSFPQGSGWK